MGLSYGTEGSFGYVCNVYFPDIIQGCQAAFPNEFMEKSTVQLS